MTALEPVNGSDAPASVSTTTLRAFPGSAAGHTKVTLFQDAKTTGTGSPSALTAAPFNDVTEPDGSAIPLRSAPSHLPSILAKPPGLHTGPMLVAAFRSVLVTGLLPSTWMTTCPVAAPSAVLLAVKTTSYFPCWLWPGVHENAPDALSKLAPEGKPSAASTTGRPPGSTADTVNITGSSNRVAISPGRFRIGARPGSMGRNAVRTVCPNCVAISAVCCFAAGSTYALNVTRVCPGRVVIVRGRRSSGTLLVRLRRATSGTFGRLTSISPSTQFPARARFPLNRTIVGRIPRIGRDVVRTPPGIAAVMTGCSSRSEGTTGMANVTPWCPSGITTSAGGNNREPVACSFTVAPPGGAASINSTPQINLPAAVSSGEQESIEMELPVSNVSVADAPTPLIEAVTMAVPLWSTLVALAVKFAAEDPG